MAILIRQFHRSLLMVVLLSMFPALLSAKGFEVKQLEFGKNHFITLCYHAIPVKGIVGDPYTVTRHQFSRQIEYLRTHGFHFISLDQILAAKAGKKPLPKQAVLLTFDDAYISYVNFVAPFLARQKIPSMVAVIGNFVQSPPDKLPEPIMSWEQIRSLSNNPYVEVISHSFDLHHAIQYNPAGNVAASVSSRYFNIKLSRYETEVEYRARLRRDFAQQEEVFLKKLGFKPRAMVWPYGRYSQVAEQVAKEFGIQATFSLQWGVNDVRSLQSLKRIMIETNPVNPDDKQDILNFIQYIKQPEWDSQIVRAVQVDMDLIYDPKSYAQTDRNLGKLIERLVKLGVNRVYLQAFSDMDGDGNVENVYFPNRVLPVVADLFSHAVNQISIRGIDVYAWMPTLAVTFQDAAFNHKNRVYEKKGGVIRETSSWYHRLSPFSLPAQQRMQMLYEDLAAHAQISGVLFQDDAYLNDFEDYNPLAMQAYHAKFGDDYEPKNDQQDHQSALELARVKEDAINQFLDALKQAVLKYRPEAKFDRNLYAAVLTQPESEAWFAQNFANYLKHYDRVVVMAYPAMEKQDKPNPWLRHLIHRVKKYPSAIKKTVFKLQSFDWAKNQWIDSRLLRQQMRTVLSSGGIHLAYYPDQVFLNKPAISSVKMEMSLNGIPRFK